MPFDVAKWTSQKPNVWSHAQWWTVWYVGWADIYFSGSVQQVAFCSDDVGLIGLDGHLFFLCYCLCLFVSTDFVVPGRVLAHVVMVVFIEFVFVCILILHTFRSHRCFFCVSRSIRSHESERRIEWTVSQLLFQALTHRIEKNDRMTYRKK